jgi:hypothetical protein
MSEIRVTKLGRTAPNGQWECNATIDGVTYLATLQYGSWELRSTPDHADVNAPTIRERLSAGDTSGEGVNRRHPPTWIALELQKRVRPLEERERRAREQDPDQWDDKFPPNHRLKALAEGDDAQLARHAAATLKQRTREKVPA